MDTREMKVVLEPVSLRHLRRMGRHCQLLCSLSWARQSHTLRSASRHCYLLWLAGCAFSTWVVRQTGDLRAALWTGLGTGLVVVLAVALRRRAATEEFMQHLRAVMQMARKLPDDKKLGVAAFDLQGDGYVERTVAVSSLAHDARRLYLFGVDEAGQPQLVIHPLEFALPLRPLQGQERT